MKGFIKVASTYINVNRITAIYPLGITTCVIFADGKEFTYYGTMQALIKDIEDCTK